MITNLLIAVAIGVLIGLYKHLKKHQGIQLPRVVNDGDEKILKPGFLLDLFLPAFSAGIGSMLIVPSDASLVTVVVLSIAASEFGISLYERRVEDAKREQIRTLLHEIIDGGSKDVQK